MVTKDKLLERMKVVTDDMSTVKQRMIENERQIKEDTALLNALTGAAQQIPMFLEVIIASKRSGGKGKLYAI